MNQLTTLFLFLVFFPAFGQDVSFDDQLWCFDAHFFDQVTMGEELDISTFTFDNDPVWFKKNGQFKRIDAPMRTCATGKKPKRIDRIAGKWSSNGSFLQLTTKTKSITFQVVYHDESRLQLKVAAIWESEE